MKYIAFILALFFLALSMIPCSDAVTCDGNISLEHKHSEDEKDHCTPLCFCSCCGISFTIPELLHNEVALTIQNYSYFFSYQNNYSFSYQESIWHPPSLS